MLSRQIILRSAALPFVEKIVRRSRLFRPVVHRFIAGDTLEEAMTAAETLLAKGYNISLDLLGENTSSREESNRAADAYITMLQRIGDQKTSATNYREGEVEKVNISIKLTQCGFDQGDDFAEGNFRRVLEVAKGLGSFVRVDMEGTPYTSRTLDTIERVYPDFPNTGTVLQSYLRRTDQDLTRMMALGCRLRLVKGAYLEPPDLAFPDKPTVDSEYVRLAKRMLDEANYPAFATQDERMIEAILAYATEKQIDKKRFEFQMLYGIRRDLQERLLKDGYRVRIYIPFGDSWYPYFTRRLAERPANLFFILKAMVKG